MDSEEKAVRCILGMCQVSVSIPRDAGEVGDESAEIFVSYSVMVGS